MAEFGPRAIVAVGKDKNGKAIYSRMLKKIADNFGFAVINKIPTRKSKTGRNVPIRGSKGSGSIKVPYGANAKTKKGAKRYAHIPMPPEMTIAKISNFLATAKKNKPETFVSEDGRTWPVGKS